MDVLGFTVVRLANRGAAAGETNPETALDATANIVRGR
jgi:hypothetical protein